MVVDYRKLNEVYPMNFHYQSKRIFYKHYPAVNGYLPLMA